MKSTRTLRRLANAVTWPVLACLGGAPSFAFTAPEPVARAAAVAELASRGVPPDLDRLIEACAQGNSSNVDLLIAAGVDPGAADPVRQVTPLHAAAAQGHRAVVERLLALGAKVDAPDWLGATPLVDAAYGGHADVVELLLAAGADAGRSPAQSLSPLSAALSSRNAATVGQLLRAGADPDREEALGDSPRALALRLGLQTWLPQPARTAGNQDG